MKPDRSKGNGDGRPRRRFKTEIGRYIMRFETNWDAVATRDIPLSVEDTLRATITLDKDAYDFKTAKQATIHMTMDYGYPHLRRGVQQHFSHSPLQNHPTGDSVRQWCQQYLNNDKNL